MIAADFVTALEEGVRRILADPKATPTQLSQAVAAGVKIEFLRAKIREPSDDAGAFFRQPE